MTFIVKVRVMMVNSFLRQATSFRERKSSLAQQPLRASLSSLKTGDCPPKFVISWQIVVMIGRARFNLGVLVNLRRKKGP